MWFLMGRAKQVYGFNIRAFDFRDCALRLGSSPFYFSDHLHSLVSVVDLGDEPDVRGEAARNSLAEIRRDAQKAGWINLFGDSYTGMELRRDLFYNHTTRTYSLVLTARLAPKIQD